MDVQLPDGTVIQGVPDGMSKADLTAKLKSNGYDVSKLEAPKDEPWQAKLGRQVLNAGAGAVRGAGSIGATLMTPYDLFAGNTKSIGNPERRAAMDEGLQTLGADTSSMAYQGGKLAGEIAGTAGAGGAVGNVLGRMGAAPALVDAVTTAGMSAKGAGIGARAAGGAINGAISAGMINPEDAGLGATVGGALPVAIKGAGLLSNKAGSATRKLFEGNVSDEVATLAKRAKELGIDIPADRLTNSRPLNAMAEGLKYVPFSGRAGTEDLMNSQLNKALSKTFGQDSSNVTMALRKANDKLGMEFDNVLSKNGVKVDKELLTGLADVYNKAEKELGSDALKPIASKIDELMTKGQSGLIDGQAAYNIKKDLDRIGRGNTTSAFHALELKGQLMDALNRSLGPDKAAAFAKTRQHYGNMLALEKLAKNGVEGEVSAARLANLPNINNQPLQELADIAAQFVKSRESQHGGAQRALVGLAGATVGGVPGLAAGATAGRIANSALNSNTIKSLMLGEKLPKNKLAQLLESPEAQQMLLRSAPAISAQ